MFRTESVFQAGDHMTPEIALRLAQQADRYDAYLTVEYGNTSILLDSLIGILAIDLRRNMPLAVVAEGADETEAAQAISHILSTQFH